MADSGEFAINMPAKPSPLSDKEIDDTLKTEPLAVFTVINPNASIKEVAEALRILARAIERRHHIE